MGKIMIKSILAYFITFFIAPLLASVPVLILLPILALSAKLIDTERSHRVWALYVDILGFIVWMFMGFLSTYVGSAIFSLFGKEPTILMLVMLVIGISINQLRRIRLQSAPSLKISETLRYIGDLLGIIVGGFYVM
jgi:hypothetical protein